MTQKIRSIVTAASTIPKKLTSSLNALGVLLGAACVLTLAGCGGGGGVSVGVGGGGTIGAKAPFVTGPEKPVLAIDQSGCGKAINVITVGPGKTFTALSQVPWSTLKGCDTVEIYPKAGNVPYNEMILLSAGTNLAPTAPNRFMRVVGMPDANGTLPIIDGANAMQRETLVPGGASQSLQYWDNNSNPPALYKLGIVMVASQMGFDHKGPPSYIGIENLEIRNASFNTPFINGKTGVPENYDAFTACLFVEVGSHLVVKNNILHNCGNGIFINSKNAALNELSQDILIDGNKIFDNGNPTIAGISGGFSEHNSYTETRGITFQNNHFGDMRTGAKGDCLKDRSSGLIVRYNTFASNCTLPLHLMDATGGMALISDQPDYAHTYVYGNLFDHTPAAAIDTNLVRYGGDSGIHSLYRKGTLHFYNNTMVTRGDASGSQYPEVFLFNMQEPEAVAEVKNNVFYALPLTAGNPGKIQTFAMGMGTVELNSNWVSPNAAQFWLGHLSGAKINGWGTNIGANNNPMLANDLAHDYRPLAASPLVNAGVDLDSLYVPRGEPGQGAAVRQKNGLIDIGAFEF